MVMKRWMAMLLSGCLLLQSWMGSPTPAYGASQTAAGKAIAEKTEGALVVEVKSSLLVPFKGEVTVEISDGSKQIHETRKLDFSESKAVSSSARFDVPQGA